MNFQESTEHIPPTLLCLGDSLLVLETPLDTEQADHLMLQSNGFRKFNIYVARFNRKSNSYIYSKPSGSNSHTNHLNSREETEFG